MNKLTDKNFIDWFSENFGYGYGTGECYTIPALRKFIKECPEDGNYDYKVLEQKCGDVTAWLMMSVMCREGILEYGTSPRYGWLGEKGKMLREYMLNKTSDELYDLVMTDEGYTHCSPESCNCGLNGYEESKKCDNPLFN